MCASVSLTETSLLTARPNLSVPRCCHKKEEKAMETGIFGSRRQSDYLCSLLLPLRPPLRRADPISHSSSQKSRSGPCQSCLGTPPPTLLLRASPSNSRPLVAESEILQDRNVLSKPRHLSDNPLYDGQVSRIPRGSSQRGDEATPDAVGDRSIWWIYGNCSVPGAQRWQEVN